MTEFEQIRNAMTVARDLLFDAGFDTNSDGTARKEFAELEKAIRTFDSHSLKAVGEVRSRASDSGVFIQWYSPLKPGQNLYILPTPQSEYLPQGWEASHYGPFCGFTEQYWRENRFQVKRIEAPFEGADRLRFWSGPTMQIALEKAHKSLGWEYPNQQQEKS